MKLSSIPLPVLLPIVAFGMTSCNKSSSPQGRASSATPSTPKSDHIKPKVEFRGIQLGERINPNAYPDWFFVKRTNLLAQGQYRLEDKQICGVPFEKFEMSVLRGVVTQFWLRSKYLHNRKAQVDDILRALQSKFGSPSKYTEDAPISHAEWHIDGVTIQLLWPAKEAPITDYLVIIYTIDNMFKETVTEIGKWQLGL